MPRYCLIPLFMLVAGCASDRVIVDQRGLDSEKFERDLAECRTYKAEVDGVEDTAAGAAVGAVIGGLIGAAVGDSSLVGRGAGTGAVSGGSRKAIDSSEEKARVVRNCMRGRGYKILN